MSTEFSEESFPEKVVIDGYVINDICWLLKAVEDFALYGELGAVNELLSFADDRLSPDGLAKVAGEFASRLEALSRRHDEDARATTAARRPRGPVAPAPPAPYPKGCSRGARHRPGTTLGAGRGAEEPARRGARRPGAISACDPAKSSQLPDRQDLRGLGPEILLHPGTHPASPSDTRVGAASGEPGGLRTVRTWLTLHLPFTMVSQTVQVPAVQP